MWKRKTFRRVKISGHGYTPGVRGGLFVRSCRKQKKSAAPGAENTKDGKGGERATRSASSLPEIEEESKE